MKATFLILWVASLGTIDQVLAERMAFGHLAPDFLAVLPIFVALYAGPRESALIGAGVGLVSDVLISDCLGPMALCLAAGAVTLATVRPRRARARGWQGALAAGLTLWGVHLLYGLARALEWGGPGMARPLSVATGVAAYSALMAWIAFPLMILTAVPLRYPARCRRLHGKGSLEA